MLEEFNLPTVHVETSDIEILAHSVNTQRLKNNPVIFSVEELRRLYEEV